MNVRTHYVVIAVITCLLIVSIVLCCKQWSNDPFVTFIIPSVNRPTLQRTLESLKAQTDPKWSAVVIFDGIKESETVNDDTDKRIQYMYLKEKAGVSKEADGTHGRGAVVRDYGITHAQTGPWIAFVDDDDEVDPLYVANLRHIANRHNPECVIFRMQLSDGTILPPLEAKDFKEGQVGISFAMLTHLFKKGFKFGANDIVEDFNLLNKLRQAKRKIYMAPHVMYYVH